VFDLIWPNFHQNIHSGLQYGYFIFLNQKDLESKTLLPKIFCNMHIARRNLHIVIESILPLTHTPDLFVSNFLQKLFLGVEKSLISLHFWKLRGCLNRSTLSNLNKISFLTDLPYAGV
jgi:hypothetical protein